MSSATKISQEHQSNLKKDTETRKESFKVSNEDLDCLLLEFNLTMKEIIKSYAENPELPIASIDAANAEMKNLYRQGIDLKQKCKFGATKGRMKILRLIRDVKTIFFSTEESIPTDTQLHNLMHTVSDTYKFLKRSDTTKLLFAQETKDDNVSKEVEKRLKLDFNNVQTDLAKLRCLYGRKRNEITDKVSLDKLEAMLEHKNLSIDSSILKDLKHVFKKVVKKNIVVEEKDMVATSCFCLLQPKELVVLFASWGDIFTNPALNLPIPPKPEDSFIDFDPSDDDFDFSTPTSQAIKKTRTTRSATEYKSLYDEVVKIHEDDVTKEKTLKELRQSSQKLRDHLSPDQFRVSCASYNMHCEVFLI